MRNSKFYSTTTPSKGISKSVEKQLKETTLKLTETQATINLFSRMVKGGLATNDVYNFVMKQSALRKASKKIDTKLIRTTML